MPRRAITAVFVHPTVVVHRGEGTHLSEIVQLTDPSKSDHHRNWKTALSCQKASGNPVARSPGIECQRGLGSPQEALHRDRSPNHWWGVPSLQATQASCSFQHHSAQEDQSTDQTRSRNRVHQPQPHHRMIFAVLGPQGSSQSFDIQ